LHRLKNLENREAWENVFELYWRMMVAVVVLVVCLSAAGAACIAFNEETQEDNGPEFAKVIEAAIRVELKKPPGELTEAVLAKVTSLNLNNTIMMDKGLKEIPKLKMLRSLNLNDTKVTRMGAAGLQKALPNCNIIHDVKK